MTLHELEQFRDVLAGGQALDVDQQRRVVDTALELARTRQLSVELMLRVHQPVDDSGWAATHPLLRSEARAAHPGDAVVAAGLELRRALDHHYPELAGPAGEEEPRLFGRRPVTEDVWDTLTRLDPGPDTVAALDAALTSPYPS